MYLATCCSYNKLLKKTMMKKAQCKLAVEICECFIHLFALVINYNFYVKITLNMHSRGQHIIQAIKSQ